MEPLYTTRPDLERSGMGFAFMEAFMDDLEVESVPGKGTKVRMVKKNRNRGMDRMRECREIGTIFPAAEVSVWKRCQY